MRLNITITCFICVFSTYTNHTRLLKDTWTFKGLDFVKCSFLITFSFGSQTQYSIRSTYLFYIWAVYNRLTNSVTVSQMLCLTPFWHFYHHTNTTEMLFCIFKEIWTFPDGCFKAHVERNGKKKKHYEDKTANLK